MALWNLVSLLPLKDAVNTVLAYHPHWKTLSRSILTRRNLKFSYFTIFGREAWEQRRFEDWMQKRTDFSDFSRRVSTYLEQYQGNKVDSFKLKCCSPNDASCESCDEWIRFAIVKGVEELHLKLGRPCNYVFPPSLHVGSTLNLKHLSLESCTLRHATADLSQLTTLSLRDVVFHHSLMPNLFSVCVSLESLTLNRCRIEADPLVADDRLTHLKVINVVAGDRLTHLKVIDCEEGTRTEIRAVNLASLEYVPPLYHSCIFEIKAPQLTRIFFSDKIRRGCEIIPQALIQFALCPGLETLHLHMPAGLPQISSMPTYHNLKQLILDIEVYYCHLPKFDVNFVLDLLKAAPFLEELVMKLIHGADWSETNQRETRNPSGFTNDHLRMVKIQGLKDFWYDIELVICILEISPKLEMLVIDELRRYYMGDGIFEHPSHFSDQLSYPEQAEQLRGVMEEKLKTVKTDAKIIFL